MQSTHLNPPEIHSLASRTWRRTRDALLVLATALSACGGSGGDDGAPPAWQVATQIASDDEREASKAQVAMDAGGNAIAVWEQSDGTRVNIWANRYAAGSGWGAAQLIESDDLGNTITPRVGIDAQGHAIAVWAQIDAAGFITIRANRYTAGAGWGTP
jgi:hypothetical protein